MPVRLADPNDYKVLYDLLISHKRVAKENRTEISLSDFIDKITDDLKIFVCEKDRDIISYMVTFQITEVPIWVMRLLVTKSVFKMYNPKENGIAELYDFVIDYWESVGLSAFAYAQPKSYIKSANSKVKQVSQRLQKYSSFTLFEYQKNRFIEHSVSKKIAGCDIYTNDVVIRMHYKNELS